jgi:hypothetical protein
MAKPSRQIQVLNERESIIMSKTIANPDTASFPVAHKTGFGMLMLVSLSYLVLYAIAILLISLTDHDPVSAKPSWNLFIPLIGLVSAFSGWGQHAGDTRRTRIQFVIQQVLHWCALLLVIHLLFMQDVQHLLQAETDGFVIIYLVGLTSLLAGIYLDWKMAVFGFFLIVSGVVIAFLDDNALLIALSTFGMMALAVSVLLLIKHQRRAIPVPETSHA